MIDKILIVNPGPVYPVRSMSQMRTHNMIRTLSKDFKVDLMTPYNDDEVLNASFNAMNISGGNYIAIKSAKHRNNIVKKRFAQILEYIAYYLWGIDREVTDSKRNIKKIIRIIRQNDYKIVISNYWEGSHFFKILDNKVFKILDPHYAVGENVDVLNRLKKGGFDYFFEKRKVKKSLILEKEIIEASDLLLPLSKRNLEEFQKIDPEKPMLLIPDGAELDYYMSYNTQPDQRTILFYGAMGSNQNRRAFWRLYNNIYPALRSNFPDLKLLVVGANPPEDIKVIDNGNNIVVTGFVEDVRPWLSQAWLSIIPLELGSGFRGRVIELMAMGIPVVGTHNALDSIDMENGIHGYVYDDDFELIKCCIKLLRNNELHKTISNSAREFVNDNYSLESTFGRLSKYLKQAGHI